VRGLHFLYLILLLTAIPACRNTPDILTVVHSTPPLSLDPLTTVDMNTQYVLFNVYEGLVGYDAGHGIVPVLAESWSNPTPTTWVFQLRKGVYFHDGSEFTSRDAVWSLSQVKANPDHPLRHHFDPIIRIEDPDPHTLLLETRKETTIILHHLTSIRIVKEGSPLAGGTGPYIIEKQEDREIRLKANPHYWKALHPIPTVIFQYMPSEDDRIHAIEDLAARHQPFILLDFTKDMDKINVPVELKTILSKTITYLGFNVTIPPFDSRDFRKALYQAIDVERIIKTRLHGSAVSASQVIPVHAFGYDHNLKRYPFDPEAAKAVLNHRSYPADIDLYLSTKGMDTAQFIAEDLAKAGITLHLNVTPWPELYERMANRNVGFYFTGFSSTFGDGLSTLEALFSSDGGFNTFGFSDPEVDRLIDFARTTENDLERLRAIQLITLIIHENVVLIPLYNRLDRHLCSAGLFWNLRGDGALNLSEIRIP